MIKKWSITALEHTFCSFAANLKRSIQKVFPSQHRFLDPSYTIAPKGATLSCKGAFSYITSTTHNLNLPKLCRYNLIGGPLPHCKANEYMTSALYNASEAGHKVPYISESRTLIGRYPLGTLCQVPCDSKEWNISNAQYLNRLVGNNSIIQILARPARVCVSVVCLLSRSEPYFCEGDMEVEHAWGRWCFARKIINWPLWTMFWNTFL